MAKKKKTKEFRLAEIAYAAGRQDALGREVDGDEEEILRIGAAAALAKWKEETGGRKPKPSNIELARTKWTAEGKPPEGTMYRGSRYMLEPDGTFNLVKSFAVNFEAARAVPGKEELEQLDIILLAVMCQKAVDDSSVDEGTRAKAEKLKQEWALLVSRAPSPDLKKHEQMEEEKAALKKRMVELLVTI